MPIVAQGSLNTAAIILPDLYVEIVPPRIRTLNGVPSDIIGVVGTASWGPVGKAVVAGSYSDYARSFGPIRDREHDAGTAVAVAVQQGASSFRIVRVADGTETRAMAAGAGGVGGATIYAKHSGSYGNSIRLAVTRGTKIGTWRAVVSVPGLAPESFDNLPEATFWPDLATALRTGTATRGPSQLISLVPGTAAAVTEAATFALAGGTDGADGVADEDLLGTDGAVRTGMYALRGVPVSMLVLADADDVTVWPAINSFTVQESMFGIVAFAAGTSIEDAIEAKADAGIDDWAIKVLHGDHLIWRDPTTGRLRTINPAAFVAGRLANLTPNNSSLNKQIFGIIGSQRLGLPGSDEAGAYSSAELTALIQAGIDVVTNPMPGGNYWGCRSGHNASSDEGRHGENYTRMNFFIARTVDAGMGPYVGEPITDELPARITASLSSFMASLESQGMINAGSWSVTCDASNNPPERLATGYLQADVDVRLTPINEKFIVGLQAGQGVVITRQSTVNA